MFTALIPTVFYEDLGVGLDLFVDGIGMAVLHREGNLVVLGRDSCKVYLMEDAEYAAKDRPQIAIEVDDIDEVFADISARRPDLLHPNLPVVTQRPWGAREFSLLDATTVCVVFRDWTAAFMRVVANTVRPVSLAVCWPTATSARGSGVNGSGPSMCCPCISPIPGGAAA